MSFAKRLRRITAIIFVLSIVTAQSRDEVVELTHPVTGSMIDTNFVDVEIAVADFFTIGSPGCLDCDGYIQITMDGTEAGQFTSDAAVTVTGLSEGTHFIEVEALDPSGTSFSPAVYDSATFTVDMVSIPNICPPRNLSVVAGDARNFLDWTGPIAMSNLNPFPSAPQSVDYHTGSTDGSSLIQNSLMMAHGGGADKEAGWAIFDLGGMNPSIQVDSIIFNYYVNTTNYPWWSATAVDLDPLSATASDLHTEILAGSDAGTAYLYRNEPSTHAPGWYSYALTNGANDDLEDDIPQGYFVIGVMDRDGSTTYFLDIDGWNEANPPSLDIHWSAPGGRLGVYHAPSIADVPYSDKEIMDYKNAVSLGLTPPINLTDISSFEMESIPNLTPRDVIDGCGDFQNYSVYTSDGTEVATTDTNYYIHENLSNGSEYCYYIVVNYSEGASSATATVCSTPETFIPGAITNLNAVGLDEEIALTWTDPSIPQYDFYDNFNSGISPTWTVTDNNGSGITWVSGEDGPGSYSLNEFDGLFAIVTSYTNTFPNTDLISSSIDLSGFSSAMLYYTYSYQDFAGNPTDSGSVYISGDGGSTWTLMNTYTVDTPPDFNDVLTDSVSLNSVVGNSDVKLKFHYEVETGESWFFAIDDIIVIGTDTSGSRDMTGSTIETYDEYIPGISSSMEFSINILSPDFAYSDSLSITFPTGVTILDAGPSVLGFGSEPYGPEPYNGIDGQTISWGTNANDGAGGIFGTLTVWASLAFDNSLSGPLTVDFHVSDDWYNSPVDIDGSFTIDERILVDGDLLGYNVYIDGSSTPHNSSMIGENYYLADGLTNGQSYTVGVTAVYYPNYESDTVSVTATPTWLYGDVTGTITDPNGTPLDSAIVSTGDFSDTTGSDGTYFLGGLDPGVHTLKASRAGFDWVEADVTIIAQDAAVTADIVLIPSLMVSNGLEATAGDETIHLTWNKPGSVTDVDLTGEWTLFYDWGCSGSPGSVPVEFTEDGGLLVYGDLLGGWVAENNTIDLSEGDGCAAATFEYNAYFYFDYYTTVYYMYVEEDVFTGMITSGYGGHDGDNSGIRLTASMRETDALDQRSISDILDVIIGAENIAVNSDEARILKTIFNNDLSSASTVQARSREDSLIGYNVYQVLSTDDTLVVTTTSGDDTTATITVPANYVEYCYYVKARWNTDNYGVLESKQSNVACAVPFRSGDIDFNDAVDVSDLLSVVDYVLEVAIPTEDQFRGADVNLDAAITINDVVLIVDLIYGTNARTIASTDLPVLVDLLSADQQLLVNLDYEGLTRGLQFTLSADASLEFGSPLLSVSDAGTMVASNRAEDGTVTVVVVNTSGGTVERADDVLVRIPYTFTGDRKDKTVVELKDLKAAGMAGESLPVTIREKRIDISVVPSVFALHQNYPNPFNPVTEIQFDVPLESKVKLTIYNIMGQEVRTLSNSTLEAGFHSVRWDGTNGLGEQVSTGLYFYRLSSPVFTSTKKMIMMK